MLDYYFVARYGANTPQEEAFHFAGNTLDFAEKQAEAQAYKFPGDRVYLIKSIKRYVAAITNEPGEILYEG